jgi:hypothetical protein
LIALVQEVLQLAPLVHRFGGLQEFTVQQGQERLIDKADYQVGKLLNRIAHSIIIIQASLFSNNEIKFTMTVKNHSQYQSQFQTNSFESFNSRNPQVIN